MATDSAANTPTKSYATDPTLYIYTSLTAGSSHIITATSRLQTILKANKVPFSVIDVATDEKARMIWGRRSGGRKLPGLVRMGGIIGDLEQIEELNEFGELKGVLAAKSQPTVTPSISLASTPQGTPSKVTTTKPAEVSSSLGSAAAKPGSAEQEKRAEPDKPNTATPSGATSVMRQIGEEAAKKAGQLKSTSIRFQTAAKPKTDPAPKTEARDTPKIESDAAVKDVLTAVNDSVAIPPPSGTAEIQETASAKKLSEPVAEPPHSLGSGAKPVIVQGGDEPEDEHKQKAEEEAEKRSGESAKVPAADDPKSEAEEAKTSDKPAEAAAPNLKSQRPDLEAAKNSERTGQTDASETEAKTQTEAAKDPEAAGGSVGG